MYGADITLKHQVSEAHYRDLLAEAERQRAANIAVAARPAARQVRIAEARTAVAKALLRAGSWLMPEDAVDGRGRTGSHAFELRPGQ